MIKVNNEKCVNCGLCIKDCTSNLMTEKSGVVSGPEACLLCGHCVAVCPQGAISIEDPEYDMSTVECLKDFTIVDPKAMLQTIKSRRSVRKYQDRPIGDEELQMMIEAARNTATAKNQQSNTYVFVQEKLDEFKAMLWEYVDGRVGNDPTAIAPEWLPYFVFNKNRKKDPKMDKLFFNAPAVMVIASDSMWDAGLASQNIENVAVAQGMGVLYNGFMTNIIRESEDLKKWLGVEGRDICTVMLMGYPAVKFTRTAPRKAADLIRR